MTSAELAKQSPDVIESEIEITRASLDRKLGELERRIDPRRRVQSLKREMQERAPQVLAWSAVAAVAAGSAMAMSGWRKARHAGGADEMSLCGCIADETPA